MVKKSLAQCKSWARLCRVTETGCSGLMVPGKSGMYTYGIVCSTGAALEVRLILLSFGFLGGKHTAGGHTYHVLSLCM